MTNHRRATVHALCAYSAAQIVIAEEEDDHGNGIIWGVRPQPTTVPPSVLLTLPNQHQHPQHHHRQQHHHASGSTSCTAGGSGVGTGGGAHSGGTNSPSMSRSHSAILTALRRPSQHLALSAANAFMNQRKHLQSLFQDETDHSDDEGGDARPAVDHEEINRRRQHNRRIGDDALTTIVSAFYGKLLVVLGISFPITEIVSKTVRPFYYQGFYLYLYVGSIAFVAFTYSHKVRKRYLPQKDKTSPLNEHQLQQHQPLHPTHQTSTHVVHVANNHVSTNMYDHPQEQQAPRFGSFYLRLGAVAFGIGSMVHSGLEFGRYFELKNNLDCYSDVLQATTPAARMLLTLFQIQFIFLNSKELGLVKHRIISRFGLMHMIATNLCEWLYVIVEETKHEIMHFAEHHIRHDSAPNGNISAASETVYSKTPSGVSDGVAELAVKDAAIYSKYCPQGLIMGSLVNDASTILFPCTIEYSLICAVILYEMWKQIKTIKSKRPPPGRRPPVRGQTAINRLVDERTITQLHSLPQFNVFHTRSHHHFTVDCSKSHNGLFAGILVTVLTIISLIMFFVLLNSNNDHFKDLAALEIKIVELILYIVTMVAVFLALYKLRALNYKRKISEHGHSGLGLDCTLLVLAQTGMFIYCTFSIIGRFFTEELQAQVGLFAEVFAFMQTSLQTMFVLDGSWRRCRSIEQTKRKPGRELITFLIIANMAMWTINSLEKNRAQLRPALMEFYGDWAWTIITHISMPLAIFYRFHSTICLFEIWKSAYKIKSHPLKNI